MHQAIKWKLLLLNYFSISVAFQGRLIYREDLKILQEQGSAWPALTYDTQLDSL